MAAPTPQVLTVSQKEEAYHPLMRLLNEKMRKTKEAIQTNEMALIELRKQTRHAEDTIVMLNGVFESSVFYLTEIQNMLGVVKELNKDNTEPITPEELEKKIVEGGQTKEAAKRVVDGIIASAQNPTKGDPNGKKS